MTKQQMIEEVSEAIKVKKSTKRLQEATVFAERVFKLNLTDIEKAKGKLPVKSELRELRSKVMLVCALKYKVPIHAIGRMFNISQSTVRLNVAVAEINLKETEDFDLIYR